MSAFEVTITPTRMRNKRLESHQPTFVCMAPFSAKSIVQFEDVPLTKTAKRILRIMNPSDEDIQVKVTKPIRPEHNVTIEWTERVVPAQSEIDMEMIWIPQLDVACKETLQLTDNRNFRKDVMVILKSKNNKPITTRKFPTISSSSSTTHFKTLRLKSPTNGFKAQHRIIQKSHAHQQERLKKTEMRTAKTTTSTTTRITTTKTATTTLTTRNLCTAAAATMKLPNPNQRGGKTHSYVNSQQSSSQTQINHVSPLSESNVRISNFATSSNGNYNVSPQLNNMNDMSKENISPLTPNNVMDLIDNLNFTPATTTTTKPKLLPIDNLACLPTPVNTTVNSEYANDANDVHQLRPRKLTAADFNDGHTDANVTQIIPEVVVNDYGEYIMTTTPAANNSITTITNRTFDIKQNEDLNHSADQLDSSSTVVTMNRTTTINCTPHGRTLTMISEEDEFSSASTSNAVRNLSKILDSQAQDLKRDIKLIGTPLRKYSESMKDLSLKSPQNKLAIQGSMPNLNEMETIRSIEQNRYFNQFSMNSDTTMKTSNANQIQGQLMDDLSDSRLSIASQADLNFNQSEILAQSSRFNLNEVGIPKSKKQNSPAGKKFVKTPRLSISPKIGTYKKYSPKQQIDVTPRTTQTRQKRSLYELSFSDTPSTESLTQNSNTKGNSKLHTTISPPKRQRFDVSGDHSFLRPTPINASDARRNWPRLNPKNSARLTKTLSLTKKPLTPNTMKLEPRIKLYDSDNFLHKCINPDPFAATITCDPFLASTMYLDERAVERHQIDFRKWLNALVTIPEDLDADSNTKIDVGKLFNEVRNKDLTLAPTKEEQSANYLTKFRLESLRRAAVELYFSEEMRLPCSKVAVYVKKQSLRIRNDRNLHLDVVMQRNILELLLCFNPLWLRLGLEVVYGEKLHLHSNRDVVGLSTFILNRLFRDKILEQKYSRAYTLSDEYANHIKSFTLQNILFLLLFLDKAKTKRIIKHNPCLFVKKSPHKETRDILLRFSSELLANVGDITRDLRRLGYTLHHKQTYLDEFDYAFNNLAVDLRDGVRLARVMEIILLRDDLTQQLRVPAISRLQRIFNVNLALRALSAAEFQLSGEISAADIVDGHREKTLSLLWQIIYNFRSPKFHAAARTIQIWWRHNWLRVIIRRRIQHKVQQRRELAATRIQSLFRGFITRRYVQLYKTERIHAAIVLQKYIRRHLVQRHLFQHNTAAIIVQRWYRNHLLVRQYRQHFHHLRNCTVFLQRLFRRRLLSRKLLLLAEAARRQRDQKLNAAAAYIQSFWRSYCTTRIVRSDFLCLRQQTIIIQQKFRARNAAAVQRSAYIALQKATIKVQRRFRANKQMQQQRQTYEAIRNVTIKLQRRRRALIQMRDVQATYLHQKQVTIKLQRRLRATLAMKSARQSYQRLRAASCILQQRYRAHLAMKIEVQRFQRICHSIIAIQRKWRATRQARVEHSYFVALHYHTIVLQQKYRATKQMRKDRESYLKIHSVAITIQRSYRAKIEAVKVRQAYQHKLQCIIALQRRFRAYKQMRFQRAKFQGTLAAVTCLQQHIRNYLLMKRQRADFQCLRAATVRLQRIWRARQAMRLDRMHFMRLRASALAVQRRYRGKLEMCRQMAEYQRERQLIIAMQRRFRMKLMTQKIHKDFQTLRAIVIKLQHRYRATLEMRVKRKEYLETRQKIVQIQSYYRSYRLMRVVQGNYYRKRQAAITLQRWYRSILQMRQTVSSYARVRHSCIIIQQRWRATLAAQKQRTNYMDIISKVRNIQRRWRATLVMRAVRHQYQQQKSAAIVLQQRYRARLEMLKIRSQYLLIVSLIVCIQRKFRARCIMLEKRAEFVLLRRTVVRLQQKFRGHRLMQQERTKFLLLQRNVCDFQAAARGVLARRRFQALLTPEMIELQRRKRAAKILQRYYRGYRVRKRFRNACIQTIRRNIVELRSKVTSANSLRQKLMDSVRILRGRFNMAEVLNVLQRLDRLSRTVPHLLISHISFIATFCYGIMAQAIRSEVDKQMIELCSRIILNLARYNSVSANTFQQNGLVTIAQMLLRWCDKDCEIFNTLCTLVWIFAHCAEKRKIIREFMTTPEAIYLLRETKKLVARKEKMKQNDRRQTCFGINKGNAKQNHFSSRALPSLQPDYDIIHNKPYTFISSVYAFDTVLLKLGIDVW